MQPSDQNELQTKIDLRMRTLRTLWLAMILNVVILFVMTLVAWTRDPDVPQNNVLSLSFVMAGLMATLVAVIVKQKILTQAAEQQRVDLVQQGYVVGWAITEVAAFLGLFDFFRTSNPYYYLLFIVAACGQLYSFPRRQHMLDACYKSQTF